MANEGAGELRTILSRSLIKAQENGNCLVRCLQTFDIFSFIPVPKSTTVSTKCSMIGSLIFFALFISFVVYDFVQFIVNNPPLPNSYYEDLGPENYSSPRFAITFMNGSFLNDSLHTPPYFNFTLEQSTKWRGGELKEQVNMFRCDPEWLGEEIYSFYRQLQCPDPSAQLNMAGLLYSSSVTTNPKIGVSRCIANGTQECLQVADIEKMMAEGRVFLFIERNSSKYDSIRKSNYLLYNLFLVPDTYNRINVQLQVNREVILPDYLTRFSRQSSTKLDTLSVAELNSNVVLNGPEAAAKLLSIEFTLAPSVKVTEVAYSTFIDHVSKWGALWGVEFAIFALIFLAYNRRKYYQKNPKWSRFDEEEEEGGSEVVRTDRRE